MSGTTLATVVAALGAAIAGAPREDGTAWEPVAGPEAGDDLSAADIDGTFALEYREPIRSLRWTGVPGIDLVEAPVAVLLHTVSVGDARAEEAAALDGARSVAHAIEALTSPGLEFVTVDATHLERDGDDLVARLAVTLRFYTPMP